MCKIWEETWGCLKEEGWVLKVFVVLDLGIDLDMVKGGGKCVLG